MRYTRSGRTFDTKTRESTPFFEVYDQPLWDRARYLVFHATACKLPWRLVEKFDELVLKKLHARACNDDCTVFTQTHGPDGPLEDLSTIRACGRFPLSNEWDMVCYHLEHKNNTTISRS